MTHVVSGTRMSLIIAGGAVRNLNSRRIANFFSFASWHSLGAHHQIIMNPTFNCSICTLDHSVKDKVRLYVCNHELCTNCLHNILFAHNPGSRVSGPAGPACPFCRTPFLFGLGRLMDIDMANVIFTCFIRWRQEKPTSDMSFYSVCQNNQCTRRFLINRNCDCIIKTRYVYFHSRQRFLAYM